MHFRSKLAAGDARFRCRALTLVGELGLVTELAEQVYHLAHDSDVSVRREAVALLGQLPGHTTERILRAAVDDPDQRVQANAIESADRIDIPNRKEWTGKKLDSDNSRVRANAVKSLLPMELRKAGETLIDMLADSSNAHRLSALWVVERLKLNALLHRIEDISRDDPDPHIREQAKRVLQELDVESDGFRGGLPDSTATAKTGGER